MLIAALLLLLVALVLAVVGILGGGDAATLDMGPIDLETNATVVFLLGMVTLLMFVASLVMFRSAGRRAAARRRDRKKVSELSEKLELLEREKTGDPEPTRE